MYVCVHVRPEDSLTCHSSEAILYFETRSLTGQELTKEAGLAGQQVPGEPPAPYC